MKVKFNTVMFVFTMVSILLGFSVVSIGAEPTKLRVWMHTAFSPESTLFDFADVYKGLVDEFEKENNVEIRYEVAGGVREIRQKNLSAAKVGKHPDVAVINSDILGPVVNLGWITPIDKFATEEYFTDYVPSAVKQYTYQDKVWGLGWYMAARAFFWRGDWLERIGAEPPKTWNDLYTTGQKLTKPGRWAIGYACKPGGGTVLQLLSHFWGFGGKVVGPNARPMLDKPKNRKALKRVYQHWWNMVHKYGIAPEDVANWMDPEINTAMMSDQIGMMINSTSRIRDLVTARPDIGEVLGGSLVPMPEGYHGAVDTGQWLWVIPATDPERQKLAWKFIRKAQEPEWIARIDREHWGVPTRHSAQSLVLDTLKPRQVWESMFKAFDVGGHPRPLIPYFQTFSDNMELGAQEVVMQKITPTEAVNRVQKRCMTQWQQLQE